MDWVEFESRRPPETAVHLAAILLQTGQLVKNIGLLLVVKYPPLTRELTFCLSVPEGTRFLERGVDSSIADLAWAWYFSTSFTGNVWILRRQFLDNLDHSRM